MWDRERVNRGGKKGTRAGKDEEKVTFMLEGNNFRRERAARPRGRSMNEAGTAWQRDVTTSGCVTLTMRRWCQRRCVITWPKNIESLIPAVRPELARIVTSGAFCSVVETIDPSTRARVKFFRDKLAPLPPGGYQISRVTRINRRGQVRSVSHVCWKSREEGSAEGTGNTIIDLSYLFPSFKSYLTLIMMIIKFFLPIREIFSRIDRRRKRKIW